MKQKTNVQYIHTQGATASAPETAAASASALDEFDRAFWSAKVAALSQTDAAFRTAQAQAATARADLEGFARYIKEKYGLSDSTEIAPDGTIVRRAQANGQN